MVEPGCISYRQCSDPSTCSAMRTSLPAVDRGSDVRECQRWPRPLSLYGLAESVNWSWRLRVDVCVGGPPAVGLYRPQQHDLPPEHYSYEHVDAEWLKRKPVSFVVFGKPGLDDHKLAAELSAYWGCIHVSMENGLADGRIDDQTMAAMRRGQAVYVGATASQLITILGIDTPYVHERGYVLTGLPRHNPGMSAIAQINAVFTANAPDVLIYMSCPNRDLQNNNCLSETHRIVTGDEEWTRDNHDSSSSIRLRNMLQKLPRNNKVMADLSRKNYNYCALQVVDEIVKHFDAAFVITVDGRKPMEKLFETIKAKLMTMPLQRTALPEIVTEPDTKSYDGSQNYTDGSNDENNNDESTVGERNERIRSISEFGELCPVNFSYGVFRLGIERYCIKFMGKLYFFAGPEELRLFNKCPRQYLKSSRPALPVRAMFYGPEILSGTAAKAVNHLFGYNIIDVKYETWIRPGRELTDVVVDSVRKINEREKNWIVVNAPMDFLLVKKLIAENLSPLQMIFLYDTNPMHKVLLCDKLPIRDRNKLAPETYKDIKNEIKNGTTIKRVKYPDFVEYMENESISHEGEEYEVEYEGVHQEKYVEKYDDEYKQEDYQEGNEGEYDVLKDNFEDLMLQWNSLKNQIHKEFTTLYIDFKFIDCVPDSIKNMLFNSIKITIYYIKKFRSDIVYDVSTTDSHDTIPTVGKYDGDTSVYCPVSFANGKFSIGSKRHMAVYRNRYYYMSSSNNFKEFVVNPEKYTSLTRSSNLYPKPKVSLLLPFGFNADDLIKEIVNTFDLTSIDFNDNLKKNILPKTMPMLGKMYEEPTSKKIMDEYFMVEDQNENHMNRIREYIDRESVYLSDEDWMKINSVFFKFNEGICYKNYPRSLMELRYLKENEINPDIIIEVIAGKDEEENLALEAMVRNWLVYQCKLIEKVIERDGIARKNNIKRRSILFKNKLAEIRRKNDGTISTKTENMTCETSSDSEPIEKTQTRSQIINLNLSSRFSELTLKHKKIIIFFGLDKEDLYGLDDFTNLEQIEAAVDVECPKSEFLISRCLPISYKPPSDTEIKRCLKAEKTVFADMRTFATSSGIPWITVSSSQDTASVLNDMKKILVSDDVLETTFDVDLKIAENMMWAGEVYLSKFGRWCPVQVYEDTDPVQRFYPDYTENRIFPVVHRKYVYFLSGPGNREKFTSHPLKYIARSLAGPPPVPWSMTLRMAVVGAPKSGKSHYAQELCTRHGFQLIQIEELAESYVAARGRSEPGFLKYFQGGALSDAALMEIVTLGMQTTRAIVQGFVLDGFPTTVKQFELLNESGVMLHRVFVLDGSYRRCSRNNARDDDGHVSDALLRYKHQTWAAEFAGEPWISECYGNTAADVSDYDGVERSLRAFVESVREYHRESERGNRPCRLADIPVTGIECEYKTSVYQYTCPVCRVDDGCFSTPRDNAHRKRHLVQYRSFFYWTCAGHADAFVENADRYVDVAAVVPRAPEPLAVATTADRLARDPMASFERFECCTVCALRSWNAVYNRGDGSYVAVYVDRTFEFCSPGCRDEFVRRPFLYSEYAIRCDGPDERLLATSRYEHLHVVEHMPVPGYLEQTVRPLIGPVLAKLTAIRPVYPGLSVEQSAKVFVGLYFGMHQRTTAADDDDVREYYRAAYERFVDTCQRFKTDISNLKSII